MDDERLGERNHRLRARLRGLRGLRGRPLTLLRRLLAAALFLVAAAMAAVPGASGEATLPVLVTARDVPSGSTLSADDVRVVDVDAGSRPDGALTAPAQAVRRRLVGAARAGEPLTDVRLADNRSDLPGFTTVPLRLADSGVTDLLRPGTRVDVVVPGEEAEQAEVLASNATVVTVVERESDRLGGPLETDEPIVLVSVADEHAPQVAAAGLGRPVTVTLR